MPPHSLPLTLLGAGILWFGWFGFNAGSALGANRLAAQALMNTSLAASAAMLGWLVVERIKGGHATTLGAASGAVAGLVAITPCAGFVGGLSPLAIGFIAGAVCFLAMSAQVPVRLRRLARRRRRPPRGRHRRLAAARVVRRPHGERRRVRRRVLRRRLGPAQSTSWWPSGATIVFSFVVSVILAKVIDMTIGLRVTEDEEIQGLDLSQHAETGYYFGELGSMGRIG